MPSAKETLDKIAQAIGIATSEKVETVEETVETAEVETTEEVVETQDAPAEEVAEEVTETEETQEVAEEVEKTEEATEEVEEASTEVEETNETPEDNRVKELEAQINELKEILKNALSNETEGENDTPEVPVDDEGLKHSPEAEVKPQHKQLGNKGGDILTNVFKYINN